MTLTVGGRLSPSRHPWCPPADRRPAGLLSGLRYPGLAQARSSSRSVGAADRQGACDVRIGWAAQLPLRTAVAGLAAAAGQPAGFLERLVGLQRGTAGAAVRPDALGGVGGGGQP